MRIARKEAWWFIAIMAVCIVGAWAALALQVVTPDEISDLGIGFQWAIVAIAVFITLGMLAGLRILRGLQRAERVEGLSRHHYLDNLRRAAYTALIGAIVTGCCGCVLGTGLAPDGLWTVLTTLGTFSAVIAAVFAIWAADQLLLIWRRRHGKTVR